MGQFHYKAVNQSGGHISGAIEAVDRRSAVTALTGQGHFVTELAEGAAPQSANGSDETTPLEAGLGWTVVQGSRRFQAVVQAGKQVRGQYEQLDREFPFQTPRARAGNMKATFAAERWP